MSKQPALIPDPSERAKVGPVYQGVTKQIRRLTAGPEPLIDANLWAGTIAAARSLAASIDAVDYRGPGQANGVPLAAMHQQLDALLARLNPEATEEDPLTAALKEMQREEERNRDRA